MDVSRLPRLYKMRKLFRGNLDKLEEQRAGYGELAAPLSLLNEQAAQRAVLARIEAEITMLEPVPVAELGGALQTIEHLDDADAAAVLGEAMRELRGEVVQFRKQVFATTIGLSQQAVSLEADMRRQLGALHGAVAQVQEASILSASDTRAIVEARLGELAARVETTSAQLADQLEEAREEREAWQAHETRERRHYQAARLRWQQGLAIAVIVLCIITAIAAWRLAQ
jgi:vacuolar-type H+-ATPase subunit I/STV1